jgi:hypothetical protein
VGAPRQLEPILAQIEKVNWDTRDIGSDTSPYVAPLMAEFHQYRSRFTSDKRCARACVSLSGPMHTAHVCLRPCTCRLQELPAEVPKLLWEYIVTHAIESLVEGYCRAKKARCAFTPAQRALYRR